MKLRFYGTRGSIPTPSIREAGFYTDEFGGNTTCMHVESKGQIHIIDAGTGLRVLGSEMMRKGQIEAKLYITHTHWDHIQGFPFFVPAYIKGNRIDIYGEAKVNGELVEAVNRNDPKRGLATLKINGTGIEEVMNQQQNPRNFPAPLESMGGVGNFTDFIAGGLIYDKNGLTIETMPINHPGGCVSYKFTAKCGSGKKVLVICTDFEPDEDGHDEDLVRWWRGADIVVADAQYERGSEQNPFIRGYGHSDNRTDIELAVRAGARRLILTHHEPKVDDKYLNRLENDAVREGERHSLEVVLAREGVNCHKV